MQIVLSNFKLWCNKCATKCDSVEAIFSPLAGVFPDHLPGCPGAAPRTEPPCWAVGPSAAASCRRPSRWRELPGSKAPARLPLLRPLTVECPHRLPGCPRAAPCLEPPSWAVRPSAAASGRRPSRWREPTEIRGTGTVAAPAPSDRRMSPPSPRLSRSCTTPRAVLLGCVAGCCYTGPKALRVAGVARIKSTGTAGPPVPSGGRIL